MLDRVWRRLAEQEQQSSGKACYAVLRFMTDYQDEDSSQLAERAAAKLGRAIRAETFRKQASRGRLLFAKLLTEEVAAMSSYSLRKSKNFLADGQVAAR